MLGALFLASLFLTMQTQKIVVSQQSFDSEDHYDLIYSNIENLNGLFARYLDYAEVPTATLQSYHVDYYLAQVLNSYGTKIDRQGYALVPALTAYRFNTITLDPKGMSANSELELGTTKVAPYAGSAVKINFKTLQGFAVLIQSKFADGNNVPLGADVLNANAEIIGMVGQGGQVYLRTSEKTGKLQVKWGDRPSDACYINYTLPEAQLSQNLLKLSQLCVEE